MVVADVSRSLLWLVVGLSNCVQRYFGKHPLLMALGNLKITRELPDYYAFVIWSGDVRLVHPLDQGTILHTHTHTHTHTHAHTHTFWHTICQRDLYHLVAKLCYLPSPSSKEMLDRQLGGAKRSPAHQSLEPMMAGFHPAQTGAWMDRANYVYGKIAVGPSGMLISPGIHTMTGAHASLYYLILRST